MNNLNFCEIHKNEIALFRCSKCSRSICSRCSIDGSSFCPKCRGTNILKVEKKHSQNEIRNIFISGLILSLIPLLKDIINNNFELILKKDLFFMILIFFALGISFASAFYFVNKTDALDEIQEIPLFGNKAIKYLMIGSSLIGIPIIYFIYLIYKFLKKES